MKLEKTLFKVIFKNQNNVNVEYADIEAVSMSDLDDKASYIARKLLEDFKEVHWEASMVVRTGSQTNK